MATIVYSSLSVGGGHGVTNYTTIAAWWAAVPADFQSADEFHILQFYNDFTSNELFEGTLIFLDKNCDATRTWRIEPAPGEEHSLVFKSTLTIGNDTAALLIENRCPYSELRGLQIQEKDGASNFSEAITSFLGSTLIWTMQDCIVFTIATKKTLLKHVGNISVYKCVFATASGGFESSDDSTATAKFYNCVFDLTDSGVVLRTGSPLVLENNYFSGLSVASIRDRTTTWTGISGSNNATEDTQATASGTGTIVNLTPASAFVDAANDDYHITTGSTLYEEGIDKSSLYTTDAEGDDWNTVWSIGVDEPSPPSGTTLVVSNISHAVTTTSLALVQANTLAVADITQTSTTTTLALLQANTLSVNDTLQGSLADNIALTQAHTLAVNNILHANTLSSLSLVQANTLVIVDIAQSSTISTLALVQAHTLVLEDILHATLAENIDLFSGVALVVQDISHSVLVDSPGLVQQNVLGIDNSSHINTISDIDLVAQSTLSIDNISHAYAADNIDLLLGLTLTVSDVAHSITVDSLALTQQHTIVVDSITHTSLSGNIDLNTGVTLSIDDVTHTLTSSTIALLQQHTLTVDAANQSILAKNIDLLPAGFLPVHSISHAVTTSQLHIAVAQTLATPPPPTVYTTEVEHVVYSIEVPSTTYVE